MGQRISQPLPFHWRWALPRVCGSSVTRWRIAAWAGAAAAVALTGVLALQHGASLEQAVAAALLLAGLPAVRFATVDAPVLIDMPGLALALGAAVLYPLEPRAAVGVAILAGAVWERAPIWAAVFAWNPLLLVGLVAPLLRFAVRRVPVHPADPLGWTLRSPFEAGRKSHAGHWRDPAWMALPWGAGLAALLEPSPWLLLALAVGYSQLLLATDTVRLYQQAAPVVCIVAAMALPAAWLVPVIAAHWLNPFPGQRCV